MLRGEEWNALVFLNVMAEIANIIGGFRLDVLPARNMNSGMVVREMLDDEFRRAGGWLKEERGGGDIDWIERLIVNGAAPFAVGVSGRKSLGAAAGATSQTSFTFGPGWPKRMMRA